MRVPSAARWATVPAVLALSGSCAHNDAVRPLTEENLVLRAEIERLNAMLQESSADDLRTVPAFTVGLAASERDFDSAAFESLLQESLRAASRSSGVAVQKETDQRQIDKIRGMLVQQYLAAEEIPIQVSNLTFKLQDQDHEFKIGGQVVPRSGTELQKLAVGAAASAFHKAPISAAMRRDAQGRYSIGYEELGGGPGNIVIQTKDVEILDTEQQARAQRQGDISFNWNLNLEKIEVYRVEGFQGDVGLFLTNMRYPGVHTAIGQYQTLRDVVLLFGYGSYVTALVNQIRTPSRISSVEVAQIDEAVFGRLRGGLPEAELTEIIGKGAVWTPCEFVDFSESQKIWERPVSVVFPFVSRQVSSEKQQVFYIKYGTDGQVLIGDYER